MRMSCTDNATGIQRCVCGVSKTDMLARVRCTIIKADAVHVSEYIKHTSIARHSILLLLSFHKTDALSRPAHSNPTIPVTHDHTVQISFSKVQ